MPTISVSRRLGCLVTKLCGDSPISGPLAQKPGRTWISTQLGS